MAFLTNVCHIKVTFIWFNKLKPFRCKPVMCKIFGKNRFVFFSTPCTLQPFYSLYELISVWAAIKNCCKCMYNSLLTTNEHVWCQPSARTDLRRKWCEGECVGYSTRQCWMWPAFKMTVQRSRDYWKLLWDTKILRHDDAKAGLKHIWWRRHALPVKCLIVCPIGGSGDVFGLDEEGEKCIDSNGPFLLHAICYRNSLHPRIKAHSSSTPYATTKEQRLVCAMSSPRARQEWRTFGGLQLAHIET